LDTLPYDQVVKIHSRDIEKLKLRKTVWDEVGSRPVMISAVIPTFNKNDPKYNKALMRVLMDCCNLVDKGILDEIVIAEGSRMEDGSPDFDFIEFILAVCFKYCKTFKSEVAFINQLPEGRKKALEGRFDFCVRILNQIDPELHKIFLKHKLLTEDEIEFLKQGKGGNLWFSIPVTYGDILCFVDSDIVSFNENYIKGLCYPLLSSWGEENPKLFSKATYTRRHKMKLGKYKIGGRLSRLAAIPLFKVLSERNILEGLDGVTYPFSGECAFTRETLNNIQFSNGYDIETSVLCQLWKKYSVENMELVDLGFFQHLPGTEDHTDDMLDEITKALFYWIRKYGLKKNLGNIEKLLDDYEKTAKSTLDWYEVRATRHPGKIIYGKEQRNEDLRRIKRYKKIILKGYKKSSGWEPKLLKPWSEIKEKTDSTVGYSYMNFKNTLQKRVNKFTSDTILTKIHVHIDRTRSIIDEHIK